MPIAIPPPDFDPTVMPPVRNHPTEAEAMENGMAPAADEPASAETAGLTKLWICPNPRAR